MEYIQDAILREQIKEAAFHAKVGDVLPNGLEVIAIQEDRHKARELVSKLNETKEDGFVYLSMMTKDGRWLVTKASVRPTKGKQL